MAVAGYQPLIYQAGIMILIGELLNVTKYMAVARTYTMKNTVAGMAAIATSTMPQGVMKTMTGIITTITTGIIAIIIAEMTLAKAVMIGGIKVAAHQLQEVTTDNPLIQADMDRDREALVAANILRKIPAATADHKLTNSTYIKCRSFIQGRHFFVYIAGIGAVGYL